VIGYFVRSLGAHFRAGRTLFLLSVLGVALGVASVLSIQVINRNALGAFEGSMRAVSGEADLSVLGRTPDFPEQLYPAVLAERGVAAAWPLYRIDVALTGQERAWLEVVGVDLYSPMRVPWEQAPRGNAAALQDRGWVAVAPELAERYGWAEGDTFEVSSGSRRVRLRIGARVDFRRITPLASTRLVVMDIAQAQGLFGGRGRLHQIDVRAAAGEDPLALRERLEQRLGPAVWVRTPEQRREEAAGLLGAFRLNLTSLSLISLFVGAFLVYASTQASLVRRRNEFGLLRSLGTTRAQLFALVLGEVGLLGALGVLLGVPLGYGVAAYNVELVSATLSNLYLLEGIERLEFPWRMYLLAAGVGLGGAVGGALAPALEMSRRDTRALLAAYTLHERLASGAGRLFAAGWGVIGLAVGVWALALRGLKPGGFVVGIGLLVGLPLLAPWVVQQVTRRLRPRRFGLRYGAKALGLKLQTSAIAVAALAVAVSMLVGITVMIGSFRRTVEIWLQSTLRADVYVTTESWSRARGAAVLDPEIVAALERLDGVRLVDRLRNFLVYSGERRIYLSGVDMTYQPEAPRFALLDGRADTAFHRVAEGGAVLISEPLARKQRLAVGDLLEIAGPAGPVRFPVAGVFYDYSSERGGAVMDLTTMAATFGPNSISNVALYLEPDVEADRVVDAIKERFGELPLVVRSNAGIRAEVFRIFDQTFAVTRLLQVMSLLTAVSGITLTLIVLARERVSELALYRALGARRRQIFRVFLGKGLAIAALGVLLGTLGGVALAGILIFLINRAYFGWTIALHWPWSALGQGLVLLVAASALASLYPALRASRTPATELTRENL